MGGGLEPCRHLARRSWSAQTPRPPRRREKMKRASAMITRTIRMVHNMGAPGGRCARSVPTATVSKREDNPENLVAQATRPLLSGHLRSKRRSTPLPDSRSWHRVSVPGSTSGGRGRLSASRHTAPSALGTRAAAPGSYARLEARWVTRRPPAGFTMRSLNTAIGGRGRGCAREYRRSGCPRSPVRAPAPGDVAPCGSPGGLREEYPAPSGAPRRYRGISDGAHSHVWAKEPLGWCATVLVVGRSWYLSAPNNL